MPTGDANDYTISNVWFLLSTTIAINRLQAIRLSREERKIHPVCDWNINTLHSFYEQEPQSLRAHYKALMGLYEGIIWRANRRDAAKILIYGLRTMIMVCHPASNNLRGYRIVIGAHKFGELVCIMMFSYTESALNEGLPLSSITHNSHQSSFDNHLTSRWMFPPLDNHKWQKLESG